MFVERLKELRKSRGLSTKEMADMCDTSIRNYQRYESGGARPSYENLVLIADVLDVSLDYLLCRDEFISRHS